MIAWIREALGLIGFVAIGIGVYQIPVIGPSLSWIYGGVLIVVLIMATDKRSKKQNNERKLP